MTVGDLKEWLEVCNEDDEILLALQPNDPVEFSVDRVIVVENTLFLVEGREIDYLREEVKDEWETTRY